MQFKFNTEYITMHYKDLQDLGEAKETYVKGYCKQVIVLFISCYAKQNSPYVADYIYQHPVGQSMFVDVRPLLGWIC